MKSLILLLFAGVLEASPFYFQTTIGGAGSFDRGLENTTAGIALGADLFKTGPITWSAEVGYSHIGPASGKRYTVQPKMALSSVPPPTTAEEPVPLPPVIIQQPVPPPITVERPVPLPPVTVQKPVPPPTMVEETNIPPPIVIQQPVPPPNMIEETIPLGPHVFPPENVKENPEPIVIIDVQPVIDWGLANTVTKQAVSNLPGGVKVQVPAVMKRFPRWDTDLYRVTGGGTIRFGRILINLNGGAERAVKDGTIMEKVEKNELINWNNGEKFRTDEWSPVLGGAAMFQFNKQLIGIAKFDYHDHNNGEKGTQTDDIIVSIGFRFPI